MKNSPLCVGAGRESITPPDGTQLFGYGVDRPSVGVHDGINITALLLESPDTSAMLITAEVCLIKNELCDSLRRAVANATDIPFDNIIVSATHTHSAPNTDEMEGWGYVDEEYCDSIFLPAAVKAAQAAFDTARPAQYAVGTVHSEVGVNRRELCENNSVVLGQNPWGLFDPTMTVIAFRGATDKKPIFNLIHYSAHGTAAGLSPLVSRDWSGIMIDRLEKQSGALTAFWCGAEGDTGPRLSNGQTTGDIALMEELGGVAAFDAVRAYQNARDFNVSAVSVFTDIVLLPYDPLISREEAEKALSKCKSGENLRGVDAMKRKKWVDVLAEHDKGVPFTEQMELRQTVVSLGSTAFVPIPFEVFTEPVLRIRNSSPFAYTLCLANTNGSNRYFPAESDICRSGYEVELFRFGNTYKLRDDADAVLVRENLRLLRKLKKNGE